MSNQSNNSEQEQQPSQSAPRPFPNSDYIRPGIDDRPDLDKALSAADKAAVARLALRQKPVTAEPAISHPEVQATALAESSGIPNAAADEPIPDVNSAFFDMRDPMVDSTGYRPTSSQVLNMKIGFSLCAFLISFVMVALTVVLVPMQLDMFANADVKTHTVANGINAGVNMCILMSIGIVVTMLTTALASALSDHTRTILGRRTPWLFAGTVLTGLFAFALPSCSTAVSLTIVWAFMQLGYAIMLMSLSAMIGEMVPDKFRGSIATWRDVMMFAGSLCGVAFATSMASHSRVLAMAVCGILMLAAGVVAVVVPPREHSSEYLHVSTLKTSSVLAAFRPPHGVRNWGWIVAIRLLISATLAVSATYIWFVVFYGIGVGTSFTTSLATLAAMAVVAYVMAAVASVLLDPITAHMSNFTALWLSGLCLLLSAICGMTLHTQIGLLLFAAFGGFALSMLDSLAQSVVVNSIEDLQHTGRVLAVVRSLDNAGRLIGVIAGAIVFSLAGAFTSLFTVAGALSAALMLVIIAGRKHFA